MTPAPFYIVIMDHEKIGQKKNGITAVSLK